MLKMCGERHIDYALDLLLLAERIVECGVNADLVTVCGATDVESTHLVLLGNDHSPLPADAWNLLNSEDNDPPVLYNNDSYATEETRTGGGTELYNDQSGVTALTPRPSSQCLPSLPESVSESPVADLSPKALFSEHGPARNSDDGLLSATSTTELGQETTDERGDAGIHVYSDHDSKLSTIAQLVRLLGDKLSVFGDSVMHPLEEQLLSNVEVVYYWITRIHRVIDNAALDVAVKLSEKLQVPLLAVMVVDSDDIEDLSPSATSSGIPQIAGSGIRSAKRTYSQTEEREEDQPQHQHQPREAVWSALQRRSAARLAVLENLRKDLGRLGVTVVCISMNSTECSDATEEQLHPEAYLWRILCGTTAGAVYGHCGQNRRSVVVADDCSLPKHSLLVRQITSSGQHGPLVLSVDSTKKGLGLSRSQEESQAIPTQLSVSEAATQLLERVSTIPGAKVVSLAQYEGRMGSILQPYWENIASVLHGKTSGAAGDKAAPESMVDDLTLWSAAGVREVLQRCSDHNGRLPDAVASLLASYQDLGLLTLAMVDAAICDWVQEGGDAGGSPSLDAVRFLLIQQGQLITEWRVRSQAVRVVAQRSPVSGLTTWATQWLDGLTPECVSSIRRIDAALATGRPTTSQARNCLATLHAATTTDGELNRIQGTLKVCGTIPRRLEMKRWLCGIIRLLRSVEAAVRVAYVELATHSLWPVDAGWYPILEYLTVVEEVVSEVAGLGDEGDRRRALDATGVINVLESLCAKQSGDSTGAAR